MSLLIAMSGLTSKPHALQGEVHAAARCRGGWLRCRCQAAHCCASRCQRSERVSVQPQRARRTVSSLRLTQSQGQGDATAQSCTLWVPSCCQDPRRSQSRHQRESKVGCEPLLFSQSANRLTNFFSGPRTAMQDAKHNGFLHVVQYLKQNGALE